MNMFIVCSYLRRLRPNWIFQFLTKLIFSVFGPVLWRSKAPHLVGFARPHLIYTDSPFFRTLTIKERIVTYCKIKLQKYFFKANSDFFVTETKDASLLLSKKQGVDILKIGTVSNTANQVYLKSPITIKKKLDDNPIRLLTLSASYPHKNLTIINKVIPELKKINLKAKFYLTIDHNIFKKEFPNVGEWVHNFGPTKIEDCPKLYNQADAMFLPTLLECFSASYPEAMCMRRPILTSNLSFAKDICKDAALYFDPMDPQNIAEAIFRLKNENGLYSNLVEKGANIFSNIPTSRDRAISYLQLINEMEGNKNMIMKNR